ncbi:hypothetical protein V6C27_03060 [Peptococcaceae bacterium 1198_IL3148]
MPRIATFIYSEDSLSEPTPQGQRMNVVNPQLVFRPLFIPSLFSFAITFGISGMDTTQENKIQLLFRNPDDSEILINTDFTMPKSDDDSELPIEVRGAMVNMNLRNVPFKSEGTYSTEVIVNGDSLGRFPIYVKGKEQV